MRAFPLFVPMAPIVSLCAVVACSSTSTNDTPASDGGPSDGGAVGEGGDAAGGDGTVPTATKIQHLVVVIQENHTFDAYFGTYCTAPTGSNPTCNAGPACCEAGPATEPSGASPVVLDDTKNALFDPIHEQACELQEMNGGKMDRYVAGADCSDPKNFAYAGDAVKTYRDYAKSGAIADRYFQPLAGQSSSNDMYFARAQFVFTDNAVTPKGVSATCNANANPSELTGETIGDLLTGAKVPWSFYAEGYKAAVDAAAKGACPTAPADCEIGLQNYPCIYDPSDDPFAYYPKTRDDPATMRDYGSFAEDIGAGKLPSVSFVKGIGYHSEHPGLGTTISAGVKFVSDVVSAISGSKYAADTLVLVTYDEGGGYFDHVAPPPDSTADHEPYGTRVPLIAIGNFVKTNYVSHVVMEHSSIVKFVEWNWLDRKTGQLTGRDAVVNNIGDLLDDSATGAAVPSN